LFDYNGVLHGHPLLPTCLFEDTIDGSRGQLISGFSGKGYRPTPGGVLELPATVTYVTRLNGYLSPGPVTTRTT
jgi:hypothetical protein